MENIKSMKASVILSIVWLIIFLLTCKTNIAEKLWGKGRIVIGKEYYRFIIALGLGAVAGVIEKLV